MNRLAVSALHIYPIKSCRGHAVSSATLDARGFVGDRRLLIVDDHGRFITQRELPQLGLITPIVENDRLTLSYIGGGSASFALPPPCSTSRDVVVWRDTVRALDLGDEPARWLSNTLGRSARLVGIGAEFSRPVRKAAANPGDEVAFTDAYPLLVLSEASLADLNARMDFPLPMNRFRPNLVLCGAAAFAEDSWRRIRIGSVVLRASGPCARCVITTTDQESGQRGKEPLRTLATYRRTADGEVNFGQNYIHESKSGVVSVGDHVEILE